MLELAVLGVKQKEIKLEQKKRTKDELKLCYMLRQVWDRSYLKWDALRRVKIAPNQYKCEVCGNVFKLREVQVDHLEPVVEPTVGWESIRVFAYRLFSPSETLQVLCQDNCHKNKSKKENKVRREQ
jgi:5-methylcytosine-specific restriction endonuclease McrA